MKDNFFHNDFERFVAENADKHKMYPSDAVWARIQQQIPQQKCRWRALSVCGGVLSLCIIAAICYLAFNPVHIDIQQIAQQRALAKNRFKAIDKQPELLYSVTSNLKKSAIVNSDGFKHDSVYSSASIRPIINVNPTSAVDTLIEDKKDDLIAFSQADSNSSVHKESVPFLPNFHSSATEENNTPNHSVEHKKETYYSSSKWKYELYATPSLSYLVPDEEEGSENKTLNTKNTHKPVIATEIGVGFTYQLSNIVGIKTGLQLNVSQYATDDFKENASKGFYAFPALHNADSVSTASNLTNFIAGNKQNKNADYKVYQISIPLGLQLQLAEGKRWLLGASASIQPTYTVNQQVYLFATDYQENVNATSFFRRWNINSAADIRVAYKGKGYQLYVGPQVRYQHLPTFNSNNLAKEFRVDYGCRVGLVAYLW